jgi:single-stranded-DNA-specific exonuclease
MPVYIRPHRGPSKPLRCIKKTTLIRSFPVWDVLHEGDYDSVADALLAGRSLTLNDLEVGAESLHSPSLLTDLERGVERLEKAISERDKIVVFGDYDVDGVTSTALLLDYLARVDASFDYVLPDRHLDGYGLKPAGVRRAIEKGARLIVTVDNGISAFEAIDEASETGVDVIVVDHHQQLDALPAAHSVINPNRVDCPYPFKGLAGVGVTFKLVQALSERIEPGGDRRRYLNGLLDLVALGTVADVMPVLGENRALIRRGFEILEHTQRPGLRHLREVAGCGAGPITATAIGFYLGPRINVAGRLASPDKALQLLRCDCESEAALLAEELNTLNAERQQLQRQGLGEADDLVSAHDLETDHIIILLGESWHLGIVGLLAGKLADRHGRPAITCTGARGDGTYTGSARSIPGYDISHAISSCSHHLLTYGGHAAAAGFSMQADNFEGFRVELIDRVNAELSATDMQRHLQVDLVLRPEDITSSTLAELERLEPFGNGHKAPVFAARGLHLTSCKRIGRQGIHLKMELEAGGGSYTALWWNRGDLARELKPGRRLSAAFALEADNFAGNGAVQLVLKDLCEEE